MPRNNYYFKTKISYYNWYYNKQYMKYSHNNYYRDIMTRGTYYNGFVIYSKTICQNFVTKNSIKTIT